ncbi:MAG: DUF998 domain-containing protein [Promethearchaeota archaeon]
MGNAKNSLDKLIEIIPGGVFGIISVIIVLTGDIISIVLFPEGYSFFENMISELGSGPYGIIFNLGLIFSGIISIPYYFSLYRSFDEENTNIFLRKSAITFSGISIISYILVGVFPSIEENYIVFVTHGIFAFLAFLTGILYLTTFSILMLLDNKWSKLRSYHGFVAAGSYLLILLTWLPITEWIATIAIISWIIANSIFMLYHKI